MLSCSGIYTHVVVRFVSRGAFVTTVSLGLRLNTLKSVRDEIVNNNIK